MLEREIVLFPNNARSPAAVTLNALRGIFESPDPSA
jgi:hypothetical protein